jgi:putative membrane protein
MRTDATLAILHHLVIFGLFALLVAERVLLRQAVSGRANADELLRLPRLDAAYGMAAGLALAIGAARVAWGMKGPEFYLANTFFWLKMGAFLVGAAVSVVPTLRYFRWRRGVQSAAPALPGPDALAGTARLVDIQLALLLSMAVFAALMARGYGQL